MKLSTEEIRLFETVRKLKNSSKEEQKKFIEHISTISEELAKQLVNYFKQCLAKVQPLVFGLRV